MAHSPVLQNLPLFLGSFRKLNFCWSATASQMRPMRKSTQPTTSTHVYEARCRSSEPAINMAGSDTVNTHTAWKTQNARNAQKFSRRSSNRLSVPILRMRSRR
eukprot:Amastigsp_a676357_11.p3 type:complete len:103 gc:universal Amastigsp_a676357_11:590-282(-)